MGVKGLSLFSPLTSILEYNVTVNLCSVDLIVKCDSDLSCSLCIICLLRIKICLGSNECSFIVFQEEGKNSMPAYFRFLTLMSFHVFLKEKV